MNELGERGTDLHFFFLFLDGKHLRYTTLRALAGGVLFFFYVEGEPDGVRFARYSHA